MGTDNSISSLPPLLKMGLHYNLFRIFLFCGFGGFIFSATMSGVSTVDKRCCPYKSVSSGTPEYQGTYRLIPDDQVYVDDLPDECSYSCVYIKDGNHDGQFCFQATDPSTSDTFSQCEAIPTDPLSTSSLLKTSGPVSSKSTQQSPVSMSTTLTVVTSTMGGSSVPISTTATTKRSPVSIITTTTGQSSALRSTIATSGQSPAPMSTTATMGQSPIPMSTTPSGQSPIPMSTTPTTGQSPLPMSTKTAKQSSTTPKQSPVSMTTISTLKTTEISRASTTFIMTTGS